MSKQDTINSTKESDSITTSPNVLNEYQNQASSHTGNSQDLQHLANSNNSMSENSEPNSQVDASYLANAKEHDQSSENSYEQVTKPSNATLDSHGAGASLANSQSEYAELGQGQGESVELGHGEGACQSAGQGEGDRQSEGQVESEKQGEDREFKIGDDVSKFTGRPHISAEENQALAKGNRFFHKALESSARARGDHYEPYSLPAHMRAALAQIDMESAQERMNEQKKALEEQGLDSSHVTLEISNLSKLHTLSAEEQEELARDQDRQNHIDAGGARFYNKYQNLLKKQEQAKQESRLKVMRNIKLMGIVMVGLIGYIAYNHFMVDRNAESIESLKASLPLVIDEHTTMVRIDDRNDNFKIYFEKDPAIFAGYEQHQKDAALDQFVKNAPGLCKNQLLRSIIVSGKKVTVLLEATDRSFFREFSVDKCPSSDSSS